MEKNNKEKILEQLMERTKKAKEECESIYEIIGRKNKQKIMQELQEKCQVSCKEADQLYNLLMEIQVKKFFS